MLTLRREPPLGLGGPAGPGRDKRTAGLDPGLKVLKELQGMEMGVPPGLLGRKPWVKEPIG